MLRFDRQLMGIPLICLALAGVISVATPPTVQAVPLPGFTGHDLSGFAIVNYAVLSPFDSFSGVLAGAYVPAQGNSGFDASKYTYLYQVANPLSSPVSTTWGALEPEGRHSQTVSATTVGAFASGNFRLDFLNGGSVVNASGNNLQGADTLGIAARTVSGANGVGSNPAFSGNLSHPYWAFNVSPGATSPLLGYQSTVGPTFTSSGLLTGFINSDFAPLSVFPSLPNAFGSSTAAPEPATLLLIGSGLLGIVTWARKQRPRQSAG
jgi:hypothetical protein